MDQFLRPLSASRSPLLQWVAGPLVIVAICTWQFHSETQKARPDYFAVYLACAMLLVIYIFVTRKQNAKHADILDGGDFLRITIGALSEDVPISNIESIDAHKSGRLTIATLSLRATVRFGKDIAFFPLQKRNAAGDNEVVADLRARLNRR
jgi:hypothetical protein